MMENKDLPAFPDPRRGAEQSFTNQAPWDFPQGMTKREYFAAMAMQSLLSNSAVNQGRPLYEQWAIHAAKAADALLAELDKANT